MSNLVWPDEGGLTPEQEDKINNVPEDTQEELDLVNDQVDRNRDAISALSSGNLQLFTETFTIDGTETKLLFNIEKDSNNLDLLTLDDTNKTINYENVDSRYFVYHTVQFTSTNFTAQSLTIRTRYLSNDNLITERTIDVRGGFGSQPQQLDLPILVQDDTDPTTFPTEPFYITYECSTDLTVNYSDIIIEVKGSEGGGDFSDDKFSIFNETDDTKKGIFNADLITTNTQRSYNLPNQNGTLALTSDIVSGLVLVGDWDANTNSPDIGTTATEGQAWQVTVAGSTNLGGITDWKASDWAVKTTTGWSKLDNSDAVTSVAGKTGAVTLASSNLTDSSDIAKLNAAATFTGSVGITSSLSVDAPTYLRGYTNYFGTGTGHTFYFRGKFGDKNNTIGTADKILVSDSNGQLVYEDKPSAGQTWTFEEVDFAISYVEGNKFYELTRTNAERYVNLDGAISQTIWPYGAVSFIKNGDSTQSAWIGVTSSATITPSDFLNQYNRLHIPSKCTVGILRKSATEYQIVNNEFLQDKLSTITIDDSDLDMYRLVNSSGEYTSSGDLPFGASYYYLGDLNNEVVIIDGTAYLEAGTSISKGATIASSTSGRIKIASSGDYIVGTALESAAMIGDIIKVKLNLSGAML